MSWLYFNKFDNLLMQRCFFFFSFTFFLYVEVAFTADGAGLPVLLRCLPDPLHQLIHLRSRALEATPCLEGRK